MKVRYWIAILIAGILIGMSAYYYVTRLGTGDIAPNFELPDGTGKVHTLGDYQGDVVLVHFWATWCDTCLREIPQLEKTYQGLKDGGLKVIGILEDKPVNLSIPLSFPVLLDEYGKVARLYGSYGVPETFVISRDGIIEERWTGPVEWSNPRVVAYLLSKLTVQEEDR